MVWKYQNEIAPTFYYGISTKTNEKDLKIPNLQPPDWKHPYWMSLYFLSPGYGNSAALSRYYNNVYNNVQWTDIVKIALFEVFQNSQIIILVLHTSSL